MIIIIAVCNFLASFGLTYWVKSYAIRNGLQDEPNQRSSHIQLTPHGGGLAIVISFISSVLIGYYFGFFDQDIVLSISIFGGLVAAIGFYDDHNTMGVGSRILVQLISATAAIILLGGLPNIHYGVFFLEFGYLGYFIGCIFLVWMTNLYNFMDGIDGFASIEAMTTTGCMAVVLMVSTKFESIWHLNNLLVASVLGFFFWNFPKAKIFMGDVGSCFLGFVTGVIMIKSWNLTIDIIFSWVILLAVFITDATYTLFSRVIRGKKFYQAHRSHGYQIASRRYASHVKVSSLLIVYNVIWLFPLAYWVATKSLHPLTGLALGYVPIIATDIYLGAGKSES
mgnify:CR=1 FL=1